MKLPPCYAAAMAGDPCVDAAGTIVPGRSASSAIMDIRMLQRIEVAVTCPAPPATRQTDYATAYVVSWTPEEPIIIGCFNSKHKLHTSLESTPQETVGIP